jgi:hypothetical protein
MEAITTAIVVLYALVVVITGIWEIVHIRIESPAVSAQVDPDTYSYLWLPRSKNRAPIEKHGTRSAHGIVTVTYDPNADMNFTLPSEEDGPTPDEPNRKYKALHDGYLIRSYSGDRKGGGATWIHSAFPIVGDIQKLPGFSLTFRSGAWRASPLSKSDLARARAADRAERAKFEMEKELEFPFPTAPKSR